LRKENKQKEVYFATHTQFFPLSQNFWQKKYKIVAAFCVLSSPFFLQNKETIFANITAMTL
jgi:hypothetical protein